MVNQCSDSTGNHIVVKGSRVRCRGRDYTVKNIIPGGGRHGTCALEFEEEFHIKGIEVPDEISIDLIH